MVTIISGCREQRFPYKPLFTPMFPWQHTNEYQILRVCHCLCQHKLNSFYTKD